MIVAGYDPIKGGEVYQVALGGFLSKDKIALTGSGSTYITGYCDTHFKENMTKEECKTFLLNAVSLAIYRDGSSGGVVRIMDVTKDGAKREYYGHNELPIQ